MNQRSLVGWKFKLLHKKESLKLDVILKFKKVKLILIANKGLV